MGTISFQVTEGGFPDLTKTYNLPDAHIDRIVVALQGAANASVNGTASRSQVLNYWAVREMDQLKAEVLAYEKTEAAKAAAGAIEPITPT